MNMTRRRLLLTGTAASALLIAERVDAQHYVWPNPSPPPSPPRPVFPLISSQNDGNIFIPVMEAGSGRVVRGSVSLDGWWSGSGKALPANGSVTMEWLLDGAPAGSGYILGPPFTWGWDTTEVADGTHVVAAR